MRQSDIILGRQDAYKGTNMEFVHNLASGFLTRSGSHRLVSIEPVFYSAITQPGVPGVWSNTAILNTADDVSNENQRYSNLFFGDITLGGVKDYALKLSIYNSFVSDPSTQTPNSSNGTRILSYNDIVGNHPIQLENILFTSLQSSIPASGGFNWITFCGWHMNVH